VENGSTCPERPRAGSFPVSRSPAPPGPVPLPTSARLPIRHRTGPTPTDRPGHRTAPSGMTTPSLTARTTTSPTHPPPVGDAERFARNLSSTISPSSTTNRPVDRINHRSQMRCGPHSRWPRRTDPRP
jgi:hypothetical protein